MSIEEMRERLAAITDERRGLHEAAGDENFSAEQTQRWADLDDEEARLTTDLKAAEETEKRETEEKQRLERVAKSREDFAASRVGGAHVTSEPEVYRQGGRQSYFKDLVRAQHFGSPEAAERLRRNDRMVNEDRALSTSDTAGGEFVPPLWMVNEYVRLARAGRVTANLLRQQSLPGGTDSISLPKVASGTSVAEQATQNTAVDETDATTSSVTAAVATVAGQQTVSLQLIEQSPANIDEILLQDLAQDYAIKADTFVISNNAANKRGLRNVSGINTITYTDADPTVAEFYRKQGDGIQQIHTKRYMAPNRIVMHPRRWAWVTTASDTTGRPLAVPAAQAPQNVLASVGEVASEGFVGSMHGIAVFVDPNLPTDLGTGTNEDIVFVLKSDDVILYEGSPRAESFRETKAANLSVLLRFYNYLALHSERYPSSISLITGTGLVAPTF